MSLVPIVAIGASAGGLKEIQEFFKNMPAQENMAFVVIQHLSPKHESSLAPILSKSTEMEVKQVQKKTKVKAGFVYIIPPDKILKIEEGYLTLVPLPDQRKKNLPIDIFFRSITKSHQDKAVAIVLSGTGSDGSLGIREVKEAGGLTLVQEPSSAEFEGMPNHAIETDAIHFIAKVKEMPNIIIDYFNNDKQKPKLTGKTDEKTDSLLQHIFKLIKKQTGHDFSNYKENTIRRRIERRINLSKSTSLEEYTKLLDKEPEEISRLYRDLLISVTSFFRDRETFDFFENQILPTLIENADGDSIRIWVAACATGEEAYSIAIIIKNYLNKHDIDLGLKIFATDIDENALEKARKAFYSKNVIADVPEHYVEKYFEEEDKGFRVKKSIREMVIFASQNMVQDPSYSKLDLITCRNVLIYLKNDLQQRALSIFNYSLKMNGVLFLGSSESLKPMDKYFKNFNKQHKVYQKIGNKRTPIFDNFKTEETKRKAISQRATGDTNVSEMAKKFILDEYTPPHCSYYL